MNIITTYVVFAFSILSSSVKHLACTLNAFHTSRELHILNVYLSLYGDNTNYKNNYNAINVYFVNS